MKRYRFLVLAMSLSLLVIVLVLSGCFLQKTSYRISGYVKDISNHPLSNVIISFGNGYSSITTDSNGYWMKKGLRDQVTVTPSRSGWMFTPSTITVSSTKMDVNFTGKLKSCIYNHLLLVYPNTDVTYYENGVQKTFKGSMSEDLKNTVIKAFKNLPNLILDGSASVVHSTYKIVVISTPIEKIDKLGDYYWVSPQDIKTDLSLYAPEGKYDSVHVIWYSGPLKTYFGLGGVFINNGKSTFSSIIAGQTWWWTGLGEAFGEPILHEWLHGVCRFYKGKGYPMPVGDADGADEHGYTKSATDGWMSYYRDLMQGKVWEPTLSEYTGITKEAWLSETPNNQ